MKKLLAIILLNLSLFAALAQNSADCIVVKDENSIICKYSHTRKNIDHNITVQWFEPDGQISRERSMTIPATHKSIYDYRYIKGRTKGEWTFKVIDDGVEYTSNFIIE